MDQPTLPSKNSFSTRLLLIFFIIIFTTLYMGKSKFALYHMVRPVFVNQSIRTNRSEHRIRCIVHVKHCLGRLGNQMFILASGYGLARLHSCHLYISPAVLHEIKKVFVFNISSSFLLSSIVHLPDGKNLTSMNVTTKSVGCQYLPELTYPNAIPPETIFELTGYWQSYLHFAKYGDELREKIFIATRSALVKVSKVFVDLYQEQMGVAPIFSSDDHQLLKKQLTQSDSIIWIGMHIRRADFVGLRFSSSDDYLLTAMNYFTSLYPNAHFLVATDDKSYCKNLFRNHSNVHLTPKSFSPGDDLIALSVCQHSIVTGGTFSWWAAYLSNGRVVHDKVYPSGCARREYYYPPWYMIDGKVRTGKTIE